MQELIEFIVKSIVNDKDAVSITSTQEDRFTEYNVVVASSDLGAVIGKGGKIAEAIRTVAKSANQKGRIRVKFNAK